MQNISPEDAALVIGLGRVEKLDGLIYMYFRK
jgi:hypothetical protein